MIGLVTFFGISILLIISLIILIFLFGNKASKVIKELKILEEEKANISQELSVNKNSLINIKETIEEENQRLLRLKDGADNAYEEIKSLSQKAFNNYCEVLLNAYDEKDQEYKDLTENLQKSYQETQEEIMRQLDMERAELDKIRSTRAAAQQAQLKEKEIKEKLAFYCLPLSPSDKKDIDILEGIRSQLTKPRILSMLIWSTYFQKPMTTLCNNVLGTSQVTGIYKITNQKTGECYIGQAVNVSDRFKQHAKCGLGIDTPPGNKLYKAMLEYGIQNFSWELLEKCPQSQLNEKEFYYIQLYDSYNMGYNSNTGISKK